MDAVKIIEEALDDLEHSKITCGEFDRIVEPFRNCVPVKNGKWIMGREKRRYGDFEETTWTCSECGYKRRMTSCPDDKFCKECGADMRES